MIAELLAERYNLHYFNCDAAFDRHLQASDPAGQPTLHRLRTMSSDAIWLVPVAEQVKRVIAIYREEFPLLLSDLAALPADRPILAEGAALMPELVVQTLAWTKRSVWVVPTPAFQQTQYAQRPWVADVLKECHDPEQAFANWMARDVAFADYVATTASAQGVTTVARCRYTNYCCEYSLGGGAVGQPNSFDYRIIFLTSINSWVINESLMFALHWQLTVHH